MDVRKHMVARWSSGARDAWIDEEELMVLDEAVEHVLLGWMRWNTLCLS